MNKLNWSDTNFFQYVKRWSEAAYPIYLFEITTFQSNLAGGHGTLPTPLLCPQQLDKKDKFPLKAKNLIVCLISIEINGG